jgi:hypothetical protein
MERKKTEPTTVAGTDQKERALRSLNTTADMTPDEYIASLPDRFRKWCVMEDVHMAAKQNQAVGKRGTVCCAKLPWGARRTKRPTGFISVFPNYWHGNRQDGVGCPSLSPMSLGPIDHQQPGLLPSVNLENFYQGNKVYTWEVDDQQNPTATFWQIQAQMYADTQPHRHKIGTKRGDKPLYSAWKDASDQLHKLNYVASRELYCHYYQQLVKDKIDYRILATLVDCGYNLCIWGYDAQCMTVPAGQTNTQSVERCYLDTNKPFGHETVIYALLTLSDPAVYPWRKFGVIFTNPAPTK